MIDHPARDQVAEILVTRTGKQPTRCSGYLVSPGWVLTACHAVSGASSIGAWLGAPSELVQEAGFAVDITQMLMMPQADLALLPVSGTRGHSVHEPVLFGRLGRESTPLAPAAAAGCPRFKLRPDPARPGVLLRELHYAIGTIAGLSDAKTGTYTFAVGTAMPGPDPELDKHSPWEGMSGAAVWSGGRLIGVIGQDHPREGLGTLTVRPVEQLFHHASDRELKAWRRALPQLPSAAQDMWLVTPPTYRKIEVARARRAAEAAAPPALIGRSAELAALQDFTLSGMHWRWVRGDAFAGKTALLAWFALHPPDRVDVVACFLRRTTGDNTAEYALDVITRQLALLADRRGYLPPPFLSERANDLADLLEEAARACAERGRRLTVLIDGLDEYDPTTASLDLAVWLPRPGTLPDEAMLLVASRAGADVRIPPAHPLHDHAQLITASEAASEVRHAARSELKQALDPRSGFIFPVVCCLAVAESGLTSSEMSVSLKWRGRDADVSEIEALLDSFLRRSLVRLPDLDDGGAQVYAFAHESLLTEARALLAADLAAYEDMFDAWADNYLQRDWPIDTPRYLLRPYTRELARRSRDPNAPSVRCRAAVDQLFMIVAQHSRILRLFERTGNPAVPDRDIVAAQHTIIDTRERSGLDADEVAFRLAVLALMRRPLTGARADVATRIAVVWSCIGRTSAAIDLAAGIEIPEQRAEALGKVAVALAEAGQTGPAQQAAAEIDDPEWQAEALRRVTAALAKGDHPRQAAETVIPAPHATTETDALQRSTQAASNAVLADAGQAGTALLAAAKVSDPEWHVETLTDAAAALTRAGRPEQAAEAARQALRVVSSIHVPWRRAEALGKVAVALAGAGQAGPALQAVASIDPWRRAEALGKVAVALADAGQAGPALQTVAKISDPQRRAETLSKVAVALASTGQPGNAAEVAGQALQNLTEIDDPEQRTGALSGVAEALSGAADALARDGHPSLAIEVGRQALQAVAGLDDRQRRAEALNRVAVALAGAGQAEIAIQAAADLDDQGRRAEALTGVAEALADAGQAKQAALASGLALQAAAGLGDREWRAYALSGVAVALAGPGHAEPALHAASKIDDPRRRAEALGRVAVALARAGHAEPALQAAAGLGDREWRAYALSGVAVALAGPGHAEPALHAASKIDDPRRRAEALGRVAVALARAGHAEPALQAAAGLGDREWRAQALIWVAVALAGAGLAEPSLRAAGDIHDTEQRAEALSGVAVALAHAGWPVQAVEATRQALRAAASINRLERRAQALIEITDALARVPQPKWAADATMQALREIADREYARYPKVPGKAQSGMAGKLIAVTDALAGADRSYWSADAYAHALPGKSGRKYAKIAMGLAGSPPGVAETQYKAAVALAGAGLAEPAARVTIGIDDPQRRAETLAEVAVGLAGAGLAEPAARVVGDIGDTERRAEVLSAVAVALAEAGLAEPAARVVGDIGDTERRAEVLSGVAVALAGAGLAEPALRAAIGIDDPQRRAEALGGVAVGLAGAGLAEPALRAAIGIDDPEQRTLALAALLPNSRLCSDGEVGNQALVLLLFTPNAPDYLAAFPVALLRRLVENGDIEVDERQSANRLWSNYRQPWV